MLNELLLSDAVRCDTVKPVRSREDLVQECAARAGMYRLLAGVFAEEPSREFLAGLRRSEALESIFEAGLRLDSDFTGAELDQLADDLACEYATMFTVSGGFPPVESVRLTGRYQQEPYFAVKEAYRRAGFKVQQGRFVAFDDQLAVELSYVAELLDRCVATLDRGDGTEYAGLTREIKRFWTLHLGKWARGYATLVERATGHSFYREMAKLLNAFAEEEIALLKLRVEDVDHGSEIVPKNEVAVLFNRDEPVCNACGDSDARLPPGTRDDWQPLKRV